MQYLDFKVFVREVYYFSAVEGCKRFLFLVITSPAVGGKTRMVHSLQECKEFIFWKFTSRSSVNIWVTWPAFWVAFWSKGFELVSRGHHPAWGLRDAPRRSGGSCCTRVKSRERHRLSSRSPDSSGFQRRCWGAETCCYTWMEPPFSLFQFQFRLSLSVSVFGPRPRFLVDV